MTRTLKFNIIIGLFLLAACDREATGQVAAVVNGEEITLQELNTELQSMQVPEGADQEVLRQSALQRIIERRLLAQEAREEGLDKTPEFMIGRRQLEDNLLVQLLTRNAARGFEVPSERATDEFMRSNPGTFAERTLYRLDRIQFPVPGDTAPLQALEDDHTMDEVAATLRQLGIEFTRGEGGLDSARINPEVLNRILSLPDGEPFILPEGPNVTVAVITGESKQPVAGDQARPVAIEAMRARAISDALRQRLQAAKADAEIEYQPGFAPPSNAKAGPRAGAGES
jgi:EpsD family peptidyl-prolyl cis-trans isomerase